MKLKLSGGFEKIRWTEAAGGIRTKGVKLPNGGSVRIDLNGNKSYELLGGIDLNKMRDNRILALAYHLSKNEDSKVILVTKDLNLRIKADV